MLDEVLEVNVVTIGNGIDGDGCSGWKMSYS